ncbi:MAG: hypothetical protein V1648_03520 [Candidatus Aenigmatarchaeota archaeon]
MNAHGLPNAEALYDEPAVVGNLPANAMDTVRISAKAAETITRSALGKYGLHDETSAPIVMDRIDPKDGVVGGYTDGNVIGINEYIVPQTNAFYSLTRRLGESRNPLAKYIYGKLSKPVDNLIRTIVHEKLHIATQMKERNAAYGRTNFLNDLYGATVEYLSEKLPKAMKPMSKYIAGKIIVPMAEGLNEGMTYEAMGLKNNAAIRRAAGQEPTSYARFAEIATDSLDCMGEPSPGHFYRTYFKEGYVRAKAYVNNFFKTIGRRAAPATA